MSIRNRFLTTTCMLAIYFLCPERSDTNTALPKNILSPYDGKPIRYGNILGYLKVFFWWMVAILWPIFCFSSQ